MRTILLRVLPLLLVMTITSIQASVGLDYLNDLRTKTGLPVFIEQVNLTASAQNHSDYMQTNNISGHYEDSSNVGYTGKAPVDRALDADYFSRIIGENVSAGQETVRVSIDGLFSAIYHRYGFLSLEKDEIGIGVSDNNYFYTYDIGNMGVNDLCQGASASSGYTGICKDLNKVINGTDYSNAMNTNKSSAPELILWPAMSSDDIPPVFYEESPDPLPNDSVTGYPVSVEFNNGKFSTAPTVASFVLTDATDGDVQENIVLMNKDTDPNGHFTAYQVTLFPKKRLEWGTAYNVELIYSYDGVQSTKEWCFETSTLQNSVEKFYTIENSIDIALDVVSGVKYAIYTVPNNTNDTLGGASWSYNSDKPDFSYIDRNTFSLRVSGNTGENVSFTFNNGQKIKLTISANDTAKNPLNITCSQITDTDGDGLLDSDDLDDDNDGYSDTDENRAGSNPLDANDKPLDTDRDMIPNYRDNDDDNDGISDSDELANGLNPLNASDAQADFDGDGFSNAIEISVGSDIRDSTSKPIWTPIMMGDTITFVSAAP